MIGLAEHDWLTLITEISPEVLGYEDFVECGRKLAKYLREYEKCDLVVALTHMRVPNDKLLCEQVPEIDIVLGGHDHISICEIVHDSLLLKSGTDFKEFSVNSFEVLHEGHAEKSDPQQGVYIIKNKFKITSKMVQVTKEFEQDSEVQQVVDYYLQQCEKEMQKVMGYTLCDLETRFDVIRTQEANW